MSTVKRFIPAARQGNAPQIGQGLGLRCRVSMVKGFKTLPPSYRITHFSLRVPPLLQLIAGSPPIRRWSAGLLAVELAGNSELIPGPEQTGATTFCPCRRTGINIRPHKHPDQKWLKNQESARIITALGQCHDQHRISTAKSRPNQNQPTGTGFWA